MNSRLALVALLAGVAACPVLCAQPMPSAGLPAEAVQQALGLAAQAAQALAPPGARIRVNPGALDPRLQLAACGKIEPALSPGQPAWGRTRIGLRCLEGTSRWSVTAKTGTVAVSSTPLMRDLVQSVSADGGTLVLQTRYSGSVAYSDVKAFN